MKFLHLPLIKCEIISLPWLKSCIISEISRSPQVDGKNPEEATLIRNNAKRCVKVVTLAINDSIKFLESLKRRLRRTIS